MTDIYTYEVDLPPSVYGAVTPYLNGYKVFINKKLNRDNQHKAYLNMMAHINNNSFKKHDVQRIESEVHCEKQVFL